MTDHSAEYLYHLRDERTNLDARTRSWLAQLNKSPMTWNQGRQMCVEINTLVAQGLAFRSHSLLSITDKGREVAERAT